MPFEKGGRADKLGNRYEGRWIVKQLLRLLNEEIESVTIEPIGDIEEGVDLWIRNRDGKIECQQCKARNASKDIWTIGDLSARGVLEKAKKQLESDANIFYSFITPLPAMMLNDIILMRQNSNENPEDFYEFQIKGSAEVYKAYRGILNAFGLNEDSEYDRLQAYSYLKRIKINQYPDSKENIYELIKLLFIGDSEIIYSLILNYPLENDLLGSRITLIELNNYLKSWHII